MGIISLEKSNHLYWLGRYSERAFTTISIFMECYDSMIDKDPDAYKEVCAKLSIPDVYGSKEVFDVNYLFDAADPNSVYSNLRRACDNAMVLRDQLSSTAHSYIEMALDVMEGAAAEPNCLLKLQEVLDNLYAFWGSIDDVMESSESRNIMKCGRYIERLDLYIRLDYDKRAMKLAYDRMVYRLQRSHCEFDARAFKIFSEAFKRGEDLMPYLDQLNNIVKD